MADEAEQQQAQEPNEPEGDPKDNGAGDKKAILADLAKERDRRQAAEQELNQFREAQKTEYQKAIDQAKAETKAEVEGTSRERVLKAEIKAAAAGRLADPKDAIRLLDLSKIKINDDGEVDSDAVSTAIEELIDAKPYLAINERSPRGSADGGPRGTGVGDFSMNDLIRRSAGRS